MNPPNALFLHVPSSTPNWGNCTTPSVIELAHATLFLPRQWLSPGCDNNLLASATGQHTADALGAWPAAVAASGVQTSYPLPFCAPVLAQVCSPCALLHGSSACMATTVFVLRQTVRNALLICLKLLLQLHSLAPQKSKQLQQLHIGSRAAIGPLQLPGICTHLQLLVIQPALVPVAGRRCSWCTGGRRRIETQPSRASCRCWQTDALPMRALQVLRGRSAGQRPSSPGGQRCSPVCVLVPACGACEGVWQLLDSHGTHAAAWHVPCHPVMLPTPQTLTA